MGTQRVVDGVSASHRALESAVETLGAQGLAGPSRLAGRTRRQVVAAVGGPGAGDAPVSDLLVLLRAEDARLEVSFTAEQSDEAALARWREVVVHHHDLDVGYDWHDWPADYVRLDLERMTMLWNSRRPMGLTGLPAPALRVSPAQRLAWLLGRASVDGLAEAGVS